jgi:hypothetical protein
MQTRGHRPLQACVQSLPHVTPSLVCSARALRLRALAERVRAVERRGTRARAAAASGAGAADPLIQPAPLAWADEVCDGHAPAGSEAEAGAWERGSAAPKQQWRGAVAAGAPAAAPGPGQSDASAEPAAGLEQAPAAPAPAPAPARGPSAYSVAPARPDLGPEALGQGPQRAGGARRSAKACPPDSAKAALPGRMLEGGDTGRRGARVAAGAEAAAAAGAGATRGAEAGKGRAAAPRGRQRHSNPSVWNEEAYKARQQHQAAAAAARAAAAAAAAARGSLLASSAAAAPPAPPLPPPPAHRREFEPPDMVAAPGRFFGAVPALVPMVAGAEGASAAPLRQAPQRWAAPPVAPDDPRELLKVWGGLSRVCGVWCGHQAGVPLRGDKGGCAAGQLPAALCVLSCRVATATDRPLNAPPTPSPKKGASGHAAAAAARRDIQERRLHHEVGGLGLNCAGGAGWGGVGWDGDGGKAHTSVSHPRDRGPRSHV